MFKGFVHVQQPGSNVGLSGESAEISHLRRCPLQASREAHWLSGFVEDTVDFGGSLLVSAGLMDGFAVHIVEH